MSTREVYLLLLLGSFKVLMQPYLHMVQQEVVKHIQWSGLKMILDLWFSACIQFLILSKRTIALLMFKLLVPTLKSTMKLSMIYLKNHLVIWNLERIPSMG